MSGNETGTSFTEMENLPADVFALIGHELRAEIIWLLGDPERDKLDMSFSELRSRLATDVAPSQLHYHLQQLADQFVVNTDGGYRLNAAGIRLCLLLRAWSIDRQHEHLSVETDIDCYYCQAPLEATFVPLGVKIVCSECEHPYAFELLDIPRTAFEDGTSGFAFSHFRKYTALKTLFRARGVCPSCAHPLSPTFHPANAHPEPRKVDIHQCCDLCGLVWEVTVGRALLADPELRRFCHDHGVDPLTTPWWEFEFAATDKHVTVHSTDPWEVALEVTFDDETLELVIDGDLNIIEHNRSSASDRGQIVLPDKTTCLQALRSYRWPDGVTCPHCNSTDTVKDGTTSKNAQRYRCNACNSMFNDLTGTIFADRHLSLPEMVHIIREMEEPEPAQIARQIDRSYGPVLDFMNVVRDARNEEDERTLSSIGYSDELYVTIDEH